ncbi:MAG: hypothetical protein DDT41_01642 [candidate division WS2 bacterium]|nr:hypothetical protein [Candidatus Psychracetigena formicireducens]
MSAGFPAGLEYLTEHRLDILAELYRAKHQAILGTDVGVETHHVHP